MWVNRTAPMPTDVNSVQQATGSKAEKFIENGTLYIRYGEKVYDITGKVKSEK